MRLLGPLVQEQEMAQESLGGRPPSAVPGQPSRAKFFLTGQWRVKSPSSCIRSPGGVFGHYDGKNFSWWLRLGHVCEDRFFTRALSGRMRDQALDAPRIRMAVRDRVLKPLIAVTLTWTSFPMSDLKQDARETTHFRKVSEYKPSLVVLRHDCKNKP
ncbi:hypothetical protein EVAR_47143_1 [Eumeta japonica]|uniref:Uncharacterized protein n=1 Tax=Eumeta variegata TaxID=151549 RepID=A0A4C1XXN6_EUMVA|nr:hypothetical protein EVAR_47143_1 [Eumeta japonica]